MEKLFEEFSHKTLKQWNDKIISDLKGSNYENLIWESPENIKVNPVYNTESTNKLKGDCTYSHLDWEIEQSLNNPTNKEILTCLNKGASALLLKDIPTYDLENVLENVLFQYIQTNIKSKSIKNSLDTFISLIEKRGLEKQSIKGSLHFDPLMDCLKKGTLCNDLWENFSLIQEELIDLKAFKSVNIQGVEYHNAGASITQELAFTLAQLSEYFSREPSLEPNKIQISLGVSTNYFFEIAKFRAIRILWTQILNAFKKDDTPLCLRAETGLRTSTIFDPHVNMLRTTSQTMSAALGGANIINTCSFNIALKNNDDFAQRIARNISLILKQESYFNKVSDPSAGSYYIENLTNELSLNAWTLFQEIEANGGWLKAVQSNFIQDIIEKNAARQQQSLESKKTHLLGTNLFPNSEEKITSEVKLSIQKNVIIGKDFKAINTNRLSLQLDLERLKKEGNHG
tara:strand:+ start:637 stop:2007 length:1371 start_codon:yes stop_codon:yes gene_type:complete